MIGRRLTTRNNFGLIVIWPVLEGSPEPRAACLAAFPYDVVFHGSRPHVRVVNVVHRAVREELVFHPRSPGCRRKRGVLPKKSRLVRSWPP